MLFIHSHVFVFSYAYLCKGDYQNPPSQNPVDCLKRRQWLKRRSSTHCCAMTVKLCAYMCPPSADVYGLVSGIYFSVFKELFFTYTLSTTKSILFFKLQFHLRNWFVYNGMVSGWAMGNSHHSSNSL